jgi:hypothetical protein
MTDDSYHCMAAALADSLRSAADRRMRTLAGTGHLAQAVRLRAPPATAGSAP